MSYLALLLNRIIVLCDVLLLVLVCAYLSGREPTYFEFHAVRNVIPFVIAADLLTVGIKGFRYSRFVLAGSLVYLVLFMVLRTLENT